MERLETGEQKAEQLVRSGLKQLHWTQADLENPPQRRQGKVRLAQRPRKETIMMDRPAPAYGKLDVRLKSVNYRKETNEP
jgi:hypothetical protein